MSDFNLANGGISLRADEDGNQTTDTLLEVKSLFVEYVTEFTVVRAVRDLSFTVRRGEVFALVGESGCGKTTAALAVMGLVPPPARVRSAGIWFDGVAMDRMSRRQLDGIRGNRISVIFQQPHASLNPVHTIGDQVAEVLRVHRRTTAAVARARAIELLDRVGIPGARRRERSYPHELSGGMAQRVMIAMAIALDPDLLIADEPTSALDVTIQAQILDLLRDLSTESRTAVILITHDLGVVAEMANRVAVMYAGQIVESASVDAILRDPHHPYTAGLIAATPSVGERPNRLTTIPGRVPELTSIVEGCTFEPRCSRRPDWSMAHSGEPPVSTPVPDHLVRCWLYAEDSK